MLGEPRSVPSRPNLRFLKLEAKRRLAAGEFGALHEAQAVIAREHGQPNWVLLRKWIFSPSPVANPALAQMLWVIDRFRDCDDPSWLAPGDDEMRDHFAADALEPVPIGEVVAGLTRLSGDLREEYVVLDLAEGAARLRITDWWVHVVVDPAPPHRLTKLLFTAGARRPADARVAAALPARVTGSPPQRMAAVAEESFAELGTVGLVLAGAERGNPPWAVTKGWADLDRGEVLHAGHRLPAYGVSTLVTATAVLRLVAEGRVGLDTSANEHLRTVRLRDDRITVRHLLSFTDGVENPDPLLAEAVPELATLMGPVVESAGPLEIPQVGNGGFTVLGQLVADVTGAPYREAVARLVLRPLGMTSSAIPGRAADLGPAAVTRYQVTGDGTVASRPRQVSTIPAVAGLWATPTDLVRLGLGWSTLLPPELVAQAFTVQAPPARDGSRYGLGWALSPNGNVASCGGGGEGASALLITRPHDHAVLLVVTTRWTSPAPVLDKLPGWATHELPVPGNPA